MSYNRLAARLLLLIGLFIGLPIIFLTTYSLVADTRLRLENTYMRLGTQAEVRLSAVEQWLAENRSAVTASASDPTVRQAASGLLLMEDSSAQMAVLRDQFIEQVKRYNQIIAQRTDSAMLLDTDGVVIAADDEALLGLNLSAEPWFAPAMRAAQLGISNPRAIEGPYVPSFTSQRSFVFSAPVIDPETGAPMGLLSTQVSLEKLAPLVANYGDLGETGEAFLIDQNGNYITPGRFTPASTIFSDSIRDVALLQGAGQGEWQTAAGEDVLGVYRPVPSMDAVLIVRQDRSEALGATAARSALLITAAGVGFALTVGAAALLLPRIFVQPFNRLAEEGEQALAAGQSFHAAPIGVAEVDRLGALLTNMTSRLEGLISTRERTIRDRTRQLELTAQMGSLIAAETNLDELLTLAVKQISETLGFYHAQIFLSDDLRQYAVLRASAHEIGQALLARQHRLPIGSQSVIGQVTERGIPILVRDVDDSPIHQRNELLPETRAELALPLRVGDSVIGALDIQVREPDAFDENTVALLQTVSDQLSVAIRNAQLFQEKEGLLSSSIQLTNMLTRDSWTNYLAEREARRAIGYTYDLSTVQPIDAESGTQGNGGQTLRLPIALRDQVIGELNAALPDGAETLSDEDREMVRDILERVALALDNARLFEQTQASLMETNRIYATSQRISDADSVGDLAQRLLDAAKLDSIDRAALYVLEDPDDTSDVRWANIAARWERGATNIPSSGLSRLRTNQFPLIGVEEAGPHEVLILDPDAPDVDEATRRGMYMGGALTLATFPLISGRRVIAWLVLQSTTQKNALSEADIRFFETLADQAATSLTGLQLLNQTRTRAERLRAVNEVTRAASTILNLDILLPLIVERIGQAFGYYHVQIFLVDDQGDWAVLQASTGEVGQQLLSKGHRLAVGSQSVIGQVTETGRQLIARNTDTDAVHQRNELLPNTRAEMAIPLKTGDRVIGALDVQSTAVNDFDDEAQAILQSLADQISVTLENAQLFQEIQDRVAELTTINLVSQAVSRTETIDLLYNEVTNQLMRTFGAKNGFLGVLVNENTLDLPIFIDKGKRVNSPPPQALGEGLSAYVITKRQTLMLGAGGEQRARELGIRINGPLPRSLLMVPLMIGDEVIGVISIQDVDRENAYEDAHVRQLSTLAAYIAVKIRNAELLEEATQRASELGFLYNLTQAAVSGDELSETLDNLARTLEQEIAAADAVTVFLYDERDEELELLSSIGYSETHIEQLRYLKLDQGLQGMVASERHPVVVGDLYEEFDLPPDETEGMRSAVVVPLLSGRKLVGVFGVESVRRGAFTADDLRLLETASKTLTAIIENARLLEEIKKANERLQELDRLKSQFLANMSHELRTPLNSIIGFSKVMLKGIDGDLNDLQKQDLTTIYESGTHLLGLINDILDMSKIESGKMEIHPEYTNMMDIINGVMATGQGLLKDKPIHILKETDPDLPQAYADPVRIRQVLLNLVSNAAKFTQEGSIIVRAHKVPPQGMMPAMLQVDVQDSGIGIAEKDMDKLFEAFRQVDGSTTRQVGGTGLGLPISKQFVEMHGGQMWVTSSPGEGSTFSFTVPLHPMAEGLPQAELVVASNLVEGGPVIVAVDDEPGVLELYQRYLEKAGYGLLGLSNANGLVDFLRQHQPKAVLMDINMPGKDGLQALTELKQTPDLNTLPVLVCSINDERQKGLGAGAAAYLVKPIIEDDLLRELDRVIQSSKKQRRVLLVDSHSAYSQELSRSLGDQAGYEVRRVGQGFEALQAVNEDAFDAMIIDIDLPDMDGYGLLMAMRSHPDTKSVPSLVLTERLLPAEELSKLADQGILYLNKANLHPHDLMLAVESLFGSSS